MRVLKNSAGSDRLRRGCHLKSPQMFIRPGGYQFVENPIARKYPPEVKKLCLKMYLNGMGFRAIAEFFQEHNLAYRKTANGRYEAEGITIFNRNIFEMKPADTKSNNVCDR